MQVLSNLGWNGRFPGLHVEQREVPLPSTAVQLHTRINGNKCATQQTDAPAEEWDELLGILSTDTYPKTEIVLISTFEKEGSFLREEQRKACQINLPRIHVSLRKIRVGGEHGYDLWRNFPGHIAADRALPRAMAAWENLRRSARRIRSELQSFSLLKPAHTSQPSRAAQIVDERIKRGRRPSHRQLLARDIPLKVKSPLVNTRRKTQRSRRNHHFGRPTV